MVYYIQYFVQGKKDVFRLGYSYYDPTTCVIIFIVVVSWFDLVGLDTLCYLLMLGRVYKETMESVAPAASNIKYLRSGEESIKKSEQNDDIPD